MRSLYNGEQVIQYLGNNCKSAHDIYFNDYIKTNHTKANTSWGLLNSEITDIYISVGGN